MRSSTTTIVFLLSLCTQALAGEWVPVLPGPVTEVVATERTVAALRDREVWILSQEGSVLKRIAAPAPSQPVNRRPTDVERTLDALDVPEIERGTDATQELLEHESRLFERRRGRQEREEDHASIDARPALAASRDTLWISGSKGVLRIEANGTLVPFSGRELRGSRIAAASNSLLVADGKRLTLLDTNGKQRRSIDLPSKPKHLALSASGQRMAWSVPGAVMWLEPVATRQNAVQADAVLDLVYCGESLVVVLATGIVVVPPAGEPETRTMPFRLKRLMCSADAGLPWIGLGDQILASPDAGRHWQGIETPVAGTLFDVAASATRLWLASSEGLFTFAESATRVDAPAAVSPRGLGASVSSRTKWLSWLPRISFSASATAASDRQDVQAFAFAAFPLDPGPAPVSVTNQASLENREASEIPPTGNPTFHSDATPDPEADCLIRARRKAVALAMSEPERARSYITRAGRAAWLPELRVVLSRRYGRSESIDVQGSSTALSSPLGIDTVNDIRYEARATWDLAKLVFAPEELAAQTQALHMAEIRREIESAMNRLYFERRQLLSEEKPGRAKDQASNLRKSHLDAELDALSGGAFAACAERKTAVERESP